MAFQEIKRDLLFTASVLAKRPFDVLIQVTNRCNMKCSFCDFWPNGAPPQEELTVKDFERVSRELSKLGRFIVSIEGGEPFVRPDLVEIVRAFSNSHLPLLYTNGWFVTPEKAKALFQAGLQQVGVSIDYPDERHDEKRKLKGASQRAWNAVETFKQVAPHHGRQVHVMTVVMKSNENDLEELLKQSQKAGVFHCVTLLSTQGNRRNPHSEDELPSSGIGQKLLSLARKYPHFRVLRDYLSHFDNFLDEKPMPTCTAGRYSFNIDHVGNVAPCIEHIGENVGNVKTQSVMELYEAVKSHPSVSGCQKCWTLCRGISHAMGNRGSVKTWVDMATRFRAY